MITKCPKCGKDTIVDLSHSISEDGEVFVCEHCKWPFRYITNEK